MRMLFVLSSKSMTSDASTHRILNIERHCRKLGADTSLLYLGDFFFSSPVLIQPLSLPSIFPRLKGFDVVHAGGFGAAYFLVVAKPLIGRNTLAVYDIHSDILTESRLIGKGRLDFAGHFTTFEMLLMEYVAIDGTDYFIAASDGVKQRLLDRKPLIRSKDVEVILNGVDLEEFVPQRENAPNSHSDSFTVTYAGSFSSYEGVGSLIRAAEMLRDEDVRFKLIGFRKDDLEIKKETRKRLRDKALLLDWMPRNQLLPELQKSDILVIPADASTREQSENRAVAFPTKFAEFLALAKPVIVTKLDMTSKIVEKFDCGFVCEPTAESIAETIRRAKRTSREVLLMKGRNGRRFAEAELDINLICKKYLKFLNRILRERA